MRVFGSALHSRSIASLLSDYLPLFVFLLLLLAAVIFEAKAAKARLVLLATAFTVVEPLVISYLLTILALQIDSAECALRIHVICHLHLLLHHHLLLLLLLLNVRILDHGVRHTVAIGVHRD